MNTALTLASDCTLVARPHPFDSDTAFARVPAGQTLAQMLGPNASHSLSVAIGGYNVPSALWAMTRPKAGQTIHVTTFPQGGNAGKLVRMVAMIALMYFSAGWAATMTGEYGVLAGASASFVQAGIMLVGSLAITPMVGQAREIAA